MRKFWHFGDSFTTTGNLKGWGYKISKKLNREFIHRGQNGASNYQILLNIINELNNISTNDYILINWSFLSRGVLFSDYKMISTNTFYFDEKKELNNDSTLREDDINIRDKNIDKINYLLDNSEQENSMVFILAKSLQDYFDSKQIRMISVFLEKDFLTSNGKVIPFPKNNYGLHNLNFGKGYFSWLKKNDYLGDSEIDTHYKDGLTDIISDVYYKKMVDLI